MSYIRIEPHKQFKKAIHKVRRDGYITYNYWGLVEVCMQLHSESLEDAREWVEYNILGLNDSNESQFGVRYADPEAPSKVRPKVRPKVGKVRRKVGR
jgi:hypothetical protein